jgi:hypothetical protein
MTAVDAGKVVIFDGRATAGAWGAVLRWLAPDPANGTARKTALARARERGTTP